MPIQIVLDPVVDTFDTACMISGSVYLPKTNVRQRHAPIIAALSFSSGVIGGLGAWLTSLDRSAAGTAGALATVGDKNKTALDGTSGQHERIDSSNSHK